MRQERQVQRIQARQAALAEALESTSSGAQATILGILHALAQSQFTSKRAQQLLVQRDSVVSSRQGPLIAPSDLAVILLARGCTLFAVGEWLLPAFRRELFVLGAVAVLVPLVLPFQYLRYQRAVSVRQHCLTCGQCWRIFT